MLFRAKVTLHALRGYGSGGKAEGAFEESGTTVDRSELGTKATGMTSCLFD